jgi:hypothetical protein
MMDPLSVLVCVPPQPTLVLSYRSADLTKESPPTRRVNHGSLSLPGLFCGALALPLLAVAAEKAVLLTRTSLVVT